MTRDVPCSHNIELSHHGDVPSDATRDVGRSLPGAPLPLTETKPTRISSDPPTLTVAASSALMGADGPPQMRVHAFHRALIPDHTIAGLPRSQRIDIGFLGWNPHHRPKMYTKQIRRQRSMSRAGLMLGELCARKDGGLR
jgi:hypothetical protein